MSLLLIQLASGLCGNSMTENCLVHLVMHLLYLQVPQLCWKMYHHYQFKVKQPF